MKTAEKRPRGIPVPPAQRAIPRRQIVRANTAIVGIKICALYTRRAGLAATMVAETPSEVKTQLSVMAAPSTNQRPELSQRSGNDFPSVFICSPRFPCRSHEPYLNPRGATSSFMHLIGAACFWSTALCSTRSGERSQSTGRPPSRRDPPSMRAVRGLWRSKAAAPEVARSCTNPANRSESEHVEEPPVDRGRACAIRLMGPEAPHP